MDVYWNTFGQEEIDMYETSKCTLMKLCAFSIIECIHQVGVVRIQFKKPFRNHPMETPLKRVDLIGKS